MLGTVNMGTDRIRKTPAPPEGDADSDLRNLVHIIVTEFNGDTSAYFDSIRPDVSGEEEESEKREARIARRFTKSI